jgi:aerobic-type carbon monoxide dehydrogenase small subunit (CoxS/CutS family)
MDGVAIRSCVTPVVAATGKIRTLEGVGTPDDPHPVQQAFVDEQVPQCGFCISGWVMYAVAMLERNPNVTDDDIRQNYVGIKCRCGTQVAAIRAVKRAAEAMG